MRSTLAALLPLASAAPWSLGTVSPFLGFNTWNSFNCLWWGAADVSTGVGVGWGWVE
jgi:hypothetical protein